jgi:hypothetical protein
MIQTIIHLIAPVSVHVRVTFQIRRYMRYAIRRQARHAGHDGHNIRTNVSRAGDAAKGV